MHAVENTVSGQCGSLSRRGFIGAMGALVGAALVPGAALAEEAAADQAGGLLATLAGEVAPGAEGTFDELKTVDPIAGGTVVEVVDDSRLADEGILTVKVDNSASKDTFASFVLSVRVADAERFPIGDFECPFIERGSEFLFAGQTLERDIQIEWGEGAASYEIMSVAAEVPDFGLLPFETIEFGEYPQGADGQVAPLQWYVLQTREDGSRLLLSKYVIDYLPYYTKEDAQPSWEASTMRAWLNGEFLDIAFSEEEVARIAESKNAPSTNPAFGIDSGYGTIDRAFLLSIEEFISVLNIPETIFDANGEATVPYEQLVSALATEYYTTVGTDTFSRGDLVFGAWALRTPGDEPGTFLNVNSTGTLPLDGRSFDSGVRPAIVLLP